ncbi:hypothetical protein D4L85_26785 [Chryseolinea soli]|uniref:Uncharacterized protein n=2 Tax=Chryseolinea soli TaxID=2321403 RepID=A0A385SQA3_9BACT|nr:hypothetical protein D4L85_26785 [Chryseolinea soli]
MILLLSMGCSKDIQMANTPNDVLPENRSRTCFEGLRVGDLIPKDEKKRDAVRFDYSPAAMDSVGCDGIYYYATFSKPVRHVLHRDHSDGQYAKYYMVVVLDGKVYPLATKSEKYRRQFLDRKKAVLTTKFGDRLITNLTPSILSGYRRIE